MRGRLMAILILFSVAASAQCKTFKLGAFGDTLNCVDMQDSKQGKWVLHVAALRGNPGYEEEGVFKDNLKEGLWRRFNLMGDKIAEENYKNGNKNGRCFYYTVAGLEREESWRAPSDSKRMYDTIMVQDPKHTNSYERFIVKTEGRSIKHGTWKYYDPVYGSLTNVENYVLDVLKEPGENDPYKKLVKVAPVDTAKANASKSIAVPKPVAQPSFGQKKASKQKSAVQ